MMDWEIQFLREKPPDRLLLNRLLYSLVSQGVEYNSGKYSGSYRIIPINPKKEIYNSEKHEKECTEKLADIIEMYSNFDFTTTQLAIDLSYKLDNEPIDFGLGVYPVEDSKCVISFDVLATEIETEKEFISFVEICSDIFERLDFLYGAYRNEYQDRIPIEFDDILEEPAQVVSFYSSSICDDVGRSKLLSAPAYELQEFNDGGIMIFACPNPQGCPDKLASLNDHLAEN